MVTPFSKNVTEEFEDSQINHLLSCSFDQLMVFAEKYVEKLDKQRDLLVPSVRNAVRHNLDWLISMSESRLAEEAFGLEKKIADLSSRKEEMDTCLERLKKANRILAGPFDTQQLLALRKLLLGVTKHGLLGTFLTRRRLQEKDLFFGTQTVTYLKNELPGLLDSSISRLSAEIRQLRKDLPLYKSNLELQLESFKESYPRRTDPRRERVIKLRSSKRRLVGMNDEDFEVLPFEIFPIGNWVPDELVSRYRKHGHKITGQQLARLELIKATFKPDRWAVGRSDSKAYKGYLVFMFDAQRKVIAENPLYGNATYLIKGGWDEIIEVLRLTKQEVRRRPNSEFVIHRDGSKWIQELQSKFRWL